MKACEQFSFSEEEVLPEGLLGTLVGVPSGHSSRNTCLDGIVDRTRNPYPGRRFNVLVLEDMGTHFGCATDLMEVRGRFIAKGHPYLLDSDHAHRAEQIQTMYGATLPSHAVLIPYAAHYDTLRHELLHAGFHTAPDAYRTTLLAATIQAFPTTRELDVMMTTANMNATWIPWAESKQCLREKGLTAREINATRTLAVAPPSTQSWIVDEWLAHLFTTTRDVYAWDAVHTRPKLRDALEALGYIVK